MATKYQWSAALNLPNKCHTLMLSMQTIIPINKKRTQEQNYKLDLELKKLK
ncbi:MAG: hypothetical protein ACRCUG_00805 [Yersinia sp. (in: enterobacteria)]